MVEIPVVRGGEESASRDTTVLRGVDGTDLATVHEAPALITRLAVKAARQAPAMPEKQRLEVLAEAGRLFADGTLVPEEGLDEDTADPDPAPEVVEEATSEPMVGKVKADDMRLAANKALKLQMEAYGEEWQGVTHAKKYLGVE